jgi:polyisoprenoid-binding protein YceI
VKRTACFVLLLSACAVAQAATRWAVDASRSSLEFTATQAGAQFDGRFARFTPEIAFDPAELAGSRFRVLVETESVETGDRERDATLRSNEFFAVERWPNSQFSTTGFRSSGSGRFEAAGTLTLRDVTRPVALTFTFRPRSDGTAELAGEATIRRLDFGVGQGEWQDTKWVGNEVVIRFRLQLRPPPATP